MQSFLPAPPPLPTPGHLFFLISGVIPSFLFLPPPLARSRLLPTSPSFSQGLTDLHSPPCRPSLPTTFSSAHSPSPLWSTPAHHPALSFPRDHPLGSCCCSSSTVWAAEGSAAKIVSPLKKPGHPCSHFLLHPMRKQPRMRCANRRESNGAGWEGLQVQRRNLWAK